MEEFEEGLKAPFVFSTYSTGALKYSFNPKVQIEKFKVNFTESLIPNEPKLTVTGSTPRFKLRSLTYNDVTTDPKVLAQQEADFEFYGSLYSNSEVSSTYASGKSYSMLAGLYAAASRIKGLFAPRANDPVDPQAFRGFIVETEDGQRVGVVNAGGNGFGLSSGVVEPAIMLDPKFYHQGASRELYLWGLKYLNEVIENQYLTPAKAPVEAVALTTGKTNPILHSFGFKPKTKEEIKALPFNAKVKESGTELDETINKYGTDSRDFYYITKDEVIARFKPN